MLPWPYMVLYSPHRRLQLARFFIERNPRVQELHPTWIAETYLIKREAAASMLDRAKHPNDRVYGKRKRHRVQLQRAGAIRGLHA